MLLKWLLCRELAPGKRWSYDSRYVAVLARPRYCSRSMQTGRRTRWATFMTGSGEMTGGVRSRVVVDRGVLMHLGSTGGCKQQDECTIGSIPRSRGCVDQLNIPKRQYLTVDGNLFCNWRSWRLDPKSKSKDPKIQDPKPEIRYNHKPNMYDVPQVYPVSFDCRCCRCTHPVGGRWPINSGRQWAGHQSLRFVVAVINSE